MSGAETDGTTMPGGEIRVFLDALGAGESSREFLGVVTLAGPRMERHEVAADVVFVVFGPNGVDLQFRDGVLVGALIHIAETEDGGSYPRPGELIADLPLPATRDAVRERFGSPSRHSPTLDLYPLGERYVEFDYLDGAVSSVSVLLVES